MATLFNVPVKRMLIVLVVLMGCKDSDKNSSLIFEELNESLERSNRSIRYSTLEAIQVLKDKLKKPEMAEKGTYWLGKASLAATFTVKILDSIDNVSMKITKSENDDARLKYDSLIHQISINYKDSILNYDSLIIKEFKNRIQFFDSNSHSSSDIGKTKLFINKLKNDIVNIENMVVVYCKNQVGAVDGEGFYRTFQAIAAINSSKLRVGDKLIVTAGIGVFNTKAKPDITINGKKTLLNENGVAEYITKVGKKIGKRNINVKISYTAADGIRDSLNKDIEYTVVE